MDPTLRGRFNMGEKEVLSIAEWARIETPGSTVDFPVTGGRAVRKNRRKRGTRITALMPWNEEQAKPLEQRLRLIRPPDSIDYRVNGRRVIRKEPAAVRSAILDTVIQEAQGQPIRPARRRTDIHIIEQDHRRDYEQNQPRGMI